jgi:hypothetical protein
MMAKYTTEVRTLIESGYDIGLKDYPIFDESYRNVLNNKIIQHYYMREIGFETAALFKFYLNRTMSEIMPLYNQYYESSKLQFNPLDNVHMVEDFHKDSSIEDTEIIDKIDNVTSSGKNDSTSSNNQTNTITKDGTEKRTEDLTGSTAETLTTSLDGTEKRTEDLNNNVSSESTSELSGTGKTTEDLNGTSNNTQVIDNTTTDTKTGTDTETKTGTNWDKYSDTPQGQVVNLESDDYLSNARKLQLNESLQKGYNNTNTHNIDDTTTNTGLTTSDNIIDTQSSEKGSSTNDTSSNSDNTIETASHQEGTNTNEISSNNDNIIDVVTKVTESDIIEGDTNQSTTSSNALSGTNKTTATKSNNTIDDYIKSLTGYNGNKSQSELLIEFRNTFINIDMMVINELNSLFLGLW